MRRALGFVVGGFCGLLSVALAIGAHADAPAPSHADIEAYDIDGNTLLDEEAVEEAVYPFLGPDRTPADVEAARASLEKSYHEHGYQSVVVDIPRQVVTNNIVRLQVIETPVGRLRVVGARYFSPSEIKRETPSLEEGKVPNFTQTQADVADLNRLPDRQVTPIFKPGAAPGTVDVDLNVKDTLPLHASVEVNNDHAVNTTDLRLSGTIRYGNLWQLGHSASFTYQVAPENTNDSEVFAGSYMAPLWGSPWSLLAFGYDSNSDVSSIGGTTVLGRGYDIGLRAVSQLPAFRDLSQSFTAGFDFKHFNENVDVAGVETPVVIQYWPLTAAYTIEQAKPTREVKATLAVTAGLRGVGSNTATFENNRAFARPNFVHANLDVDFRQTIWAHAQIDARFSGQIADQPLVTTEQIAAGGLTSVRGYYQAEEVGDDGMVGSFEVRSPPIGKLSPWLDDWRIYAFVDAAHLWVLDPLADQADQFSLLSTGLGTRFDFYRHLHSDVGVAWPLTRGASPTPRSAQAMFDVKTEF